MHNFKSDEGNVVKALADIIDKNAFSLYEIRTRIGSTEQETLFFVSFLKQNKYYLTKKQKYFCFLFCKSESRSSRSFRSSRASRASSSSRSARSSMDLQVLQVLPVELKIFSLISLILFALVQPKIGDRHVLLHQPQNTDSVIYQTPAPARK